MLRCRQQARNKLATSRCNGIWELNDTTVVTSDDTHIHNGLDRVNLLRTCYGETCVMDFDLNALCCVIAYVSMSQTWVLCFIHRPCLSHGGPPPCHRRRAATTTGLAETPIWSSKIHLAESDRRGRSAPELWGPHGLEEGKGKGYLASSRQYGNALL